MVTVGEGVRVRVVRFWWTWRVDVDVDVDGSWWCKPDRSVTKQTGHMGDS